MKKEYLNFLLSEYAKSGQPVQHIFLGDEKYIIPMIKEIKK